MLDNIPLTGETVVEVDGDADQLIEFLRIRGFTVEPTARDGGWALALHSSHPESETVEIFVALHTWLEQGGSGRPVVQQGGRSFPIAQLLT
jgi:hypothetical protein